MHIDFARHPTEYIIMLGVADNSQITWNMKI